MQGMWTWNSAARAGQGLRSPGLAGVNAPREMRISPEKHTGAGGSPPFVQSG